MKFYRQDLLLFDCDNDKEVKLLIPHVMIETAKQVYGELTDEIEISISAMWSLVTKNKRPLAKRERDKLVVLFNEYFNDEDTVEYDTDFKLIVTKKDDEETDDTFILVSINDITQIFINTTMAKLPKQLANLLNIQSYFNGKYTYLSSEDLIIEITKVHESEMDFNDSKTWFKYYTYKQLEEVASKFVAYPKLDQLLTKRFNTDKVGLKKQYLADDNFNDYIAELEKLGIICKVRTKYGIHGNKTVFCRVEHKEVCIALYNRMEQLKQMAKEHKDENEIENEVEEVKEVPTKKECSFAHGRRRPKFH